MHDDFYGEIYLWTIDDPQIISKMDIQPEANTLKFEVKEDAANKHGICVYGKALDEMEKENATPITIKLMK